MRHSGSGLGPTWAHPTCYRRGTRLPEAQVDVDPPPLERAQCAEHRAHVLGAAAMRNETAIRPRSLSGASSLWPHRPFRLALLRAAWLRCLHDRPVAALQPWHDSRDTARRHYARGDSSGKRASAAAAHATRETPGFRSFSLEVRAPTYRRTGGKGTYSRGTAPSARKSKRTCCARRRGTAARPCRCALVSIRRRNSKPSSTVAYRRVPSSTVEHRRVPPSTVAYRRVRSSTVEYRRVPSSTVAYRRARGSAHALGMQTRLGPPARP